MVLWAVMDIGTNSCRLLIAEYQQETGQINPVQRALRTTRLGLGMKEQNGLLAPEAIERTLRGLGEYARLIQHYPVEKVCLLATQAVREAGNREELAEKIKTKFGWDLQIIPGETEAKLSYLGARQGLFTEAVPVVIDIGGGSTEVITEVVSERGQKTYQVKSIPLGALRLWEKAQTDEELQGFFEKELQSFFMPARFSLVGVGGTVTTVAAVKLGLVQYEAERVQGLKLKLFEIKELYQKLKELSPEERLQVPGITRGREDIIIPGMQILINLMRFWETEQITVSDQDLLYGAIIANK